MNSLNNLYPQLTSLKCSECDSFLILVDKKVEILEDQHLPVTTSTYHCSNKECHDLMEKRTAERLKKIAEQEKMRLDRLEKRRLNAVKKSA